MGVPITEDNAAEVIDFMRSRYHHNPEDLDLIRHCRGLLIARLLRQMDAHVEKLKGELAQADTPGWGAF